MSRRVRLALAALAFLMTSSHRHAMGFWHPMAVVEKLARLKCEHWPGCLFGSMDWQSWPLAMVLPLSGGSVAAAALGFSLLRRRLPGLADGLNVLAGAQTGVGVAALAVVFDLGSFGPTHLIWVLLHFVPAWAMRLAPARAAWLGAGMLAVALAFFTVWRDVTAC